MIFFGFAEHQRRVTFGLGSKVTKTENSDNSVLITANATNNAKNKIISFQWYVPQNSPSIEHAKLITKQILNRLPTEPLYVETSVFLEEVNNRNFLTSELWTQVGKNVLSWIFVGFQQRNRQHSRNLSNDNLYRPQVTSAECIIGTKNPDAAILIECDDDDCSDGFARIEENF